MMGRPLRKPSYCDARNERATEAGQYILAALAQSLYHVYLGHGGEKWVNWNDAGSRCDTRSALVATGDNTPVCVLTGM